VVFFLVLANEERNFLYSSPLWDSVPFSILYVLYVLYIGKRINREDSLTGILVYRRHNEEIEREMNHNDSSTDNIFH